MHSIRVPGGITLQANVTDNPRPREVLGFNVIDHGTLLRSFIGTKGTNIVSSFSLDKVTMYLLVKFFIAYVNI